MSLYLDTSVLVAIFAKEATADKLVKLLNRGQFPPPNISDWNVTEFAAAISFKFCQKMIDDELRDAAVSKFQAAQNTLFSLIPVSSADFTRAATFAHQADLRLRGGDALHLSIAAGRRLQILTLDKRMKAAAVTLGLGVADFN